uniref:Holliday junction resolvase RuvC n=1 Tax=viral metagenome TaxID=1070528 RepID=A0A6M3JK13_9ZZZZ
MNILAIDPGTLCGYAKSPVESGTWDLRVKRDEGGGMRYIRLRNHLITAGEEVELVVYEEVMRHLGTGAAHIYGGIVAIIQEHCEMHEIPYCGAPVGTVKKFATGKGNANKDAMVAAAQAKWPDIDIKDDNQADALWILAWARNEYE